MQIEQTHWTEFGVALRGVYEPGMRATHNDPGHDAAIVDVEVTGLVFEKRVRDREFGQFINVEFDCFKGVDMTNSEIKKLLGNIADALGDVAEEALWEAL